MAFKIAEKKPLNAIQVISKNDDALDTDKSNWEQYEKTGDVAHLVFVPDKQPTIFLCNFELKGKQAAAIKNSMLGGRDDEGNASVALGTWSFRVVKQTLKDIKNPADLSPAECIQFKADKDGLAHDDVLAELDRYGVLNEIFAMFTALTMAGVKGNAKNS
jgi:hypothetical protein